MIWVDLGVVVVAGVMIAVTVAVLRHERGTALAQEQALELEADERAKAVVPRRVIRGVVVASVTHGRR